MIAVTLYFPDEIEQAIKDYGRLVGVDVSRPVSREYRLTQFYAGVIMGSIVTGMGRPDLALEFEQMNYRKSDAPES